MSNFKKTSTVLIRKAKKEDVNQIMLLLDQVLKIHIYIRPDKEKITLVLEKNDKILGIIVLKVKKVKNHVNLKDSKVLWVDELCVSEKSRQKGIGKQLINKAIEIAKDLHCVRLELNCWELNDEAIKFYKKQEMQTQRRIMEIKI